MIKAKKEREEKKLSINIILILFNVIVIFVVLPTQQNQLESFDDDWKSQQ